MVNEYDNLTNKLFKDQEPAQVEGDYDSIASDMFEPSEEKFNQSQFAAKTKQPQQVNEAFKVAQEHNVPIGFAEENLEAFKEKQDKTDMSYGAIIERSPRLAKWMENPHQAAVANEDLEYLSQVEMQVGRISNYEDAPSYLGDLGRAGKVGTDNLTSSLALLFAAEGIIDIADYAEFIAEKNKAVQKVSANLPPYAVEFNKSMEKEGADIDRAFEQFKRSYTEMKEGNILDALIDFGAGGGKTVGESIDLIGSFVVRPKGAIRSVVESLAYSAPALATGYAGMKVAGAAGLAIPIPGAAPVLGAIGLAAGTFAGSAPTEIGATFNEELSQKFDTTNPDDLIRAFRDKEMIANVRAAARRKGLTTAGLDSLFTLFAGRFFKGVQGAGKLKKAAAFAKDTSVQMFGEFGSEFGGQVAKEEGDLSQVSIGQSWVEGVTSLGHSVGEVALTSSYRQIFPESTVDAAEEVVETVNKASESLSELEALEQLMDISENSKLQTENPQLFSELVAAVNVDGGADQAVYFQKDAWDEHHKSIGESPVAAMEALLGSSEAYDSAAKTGQPIAIPLNEFVTGGNKELLAIVQTKPDGMDAEAALQIMQEAPAIMEELAIEAKAEKKLRDKAREDAKQLEKNVTEQLKAVGRDPIEAAPIAAFYRTMSDTEQGTALELFEEHGVEFANIEGEIVSQKGDQVLEQVKKGHIRIKKNKNIIEFFKAADKSTLIHESGHHYLEVVNKMQALDTASPEIKEKFQVISDWLELKPGEKISVGQHEKFARGIELYFREGKAPSKRLRKAFNTFKVWLTAIYKNASELNVEMSDEVRSMMDSLFATQEEIEQAQQKMGPPMLSDPIAQGMTKDKAAEYREAIENAEMSAKERLEVQVLKDTEKRKKIQSKINRERIESAVKEEPIFKAIGELQSSEPVDGAPALKFDRDLFKQSYPELAGAKQFKGMFADDGTGMAPDMISAVLGFDSGAVLVEQISQTPTFKAVVEAEVKRLTEEQFALEETPSEVDERVDIALHNMDRGKRIRMEYDHLATNHKGLSREVIRRVTRRPAPSADIKQIATEVIEELNVGQIRPNDYRLAERRYAKEAGHKLAAGDIEGAFKAKQSELLNYYLYRQAQEAKLAVKKGEKSSKRFFEKDEKLAKTRDMDLINAARAILTRYGLGNAKGDALSQISKIKEYNPDAYETVASIVTGLVSDPANYKDISYLKFQDLMEGTQSLWDLARDLKEVEVDGKKVSVEQANEELAAEMEKFKSKKGSQDKYDRTASKNDKWRIKLLGLKAQFRRLEHWADVMDSGKIEGPFRKYLVTPISEATDKFAVTNKKFKKKFLELSKPIADKIEYGKEIKSPEIGFAFRDKSELLGALLHRGNLGNFTKLLVGRGWGSLDDQNNLVHHKWDQFIARMEKEGVILKEDYDYIQSVWDLMEEIKPMSQKTHKKIFGYYFDEITANSFETSYGTYKGGYAPAKIDTHEVTDIARKQELEAFVKGNPSYDYPASGGKGFTKSRVDSYNKPLSLDMSLVGKHITDVLKFAIIKPAVVDAAKIATSQSFKTAMGDIDPTVINKMIKPALNRADKNQISQTDPSDDSTMLHFANTLRNSASMQLMFANITNTVEQVAGLSVAATRIRASYIARASAQFAKSPKVTAEFVREKSEYMASRTDDQIFEMEKIVKDVFSESTKYQDAKNLAKKHAFFAQAFTQNIVDFTVWSASYDESVANNKTEKQAIRKADADIRMTQTSRRAFDVSNFETNQWIGIFHMFYNFFNTMYNVNASNFAKLYYEDLSLGKKSAKGMYLLMMGYSSIAVISAAIKKAASGGLDEDEDGEYMDDLYDVFIGSQIDLGFAMIPIFGPGLNAGIKELTGGKPYETRLTASPAVSIMATATRSLGKLAKGDYFDGDISRGEVKDGLTALGLFSGLPLAPLAKPITYLQAVESGKAKPTGPIDALRGVLTGKPGVR